MLRWPAALASALLVVLPSFGQEPAESRLVSVGLFKNGLTLVKREVSLPKEGTYRLDDPIELIHGTFWLESDTPIEARVQECEVEASAPPSLGLDLQHELAGRNVVVHFKSEKRPAIQGRMADLHPPKLRSLSEGIGTAAPRGAGAGKYLLVIGDRKRYYIDPSDIASVEAEDGPAKSKKKESRLVISVGEGQVPKNGKAIVRYVTKGLSWAASYQIDLSDPKTLRLRQGALLRNEWASIKDAEVYLITGSAGVKYAEHWSPLAPSVSWASFMGAIAQGIFAHPASLLTNNDKMFSNNFVSNTVTRVARGIDGAGGVADVSALHYHSIGKRTLNEGEALSANVVDAKIAYERVVEWVIPPTQPTAAATDGVQDVWDGLRFRNPFDFPLTGGPAMMMDRDQFLGQQFLEYASPAETEFLKINKALNVRTRHDEVREAKVDNVSIGTWSYEKVTFQSSFTIRNLRKETAKFIVRRTIQGEILSAEGDPKKLARSDTASEVNAHQELAWELTVPSGETKTVQYRYSFLYPRR